MSNTQSNTTGATAAGASGARPGGPTATLVAKHDRMQFLSRLFGAHMLAGESQVYHWMRSLCRSYRGGFWNFYTLSNGGFYMAPDDSGSGKLLHLSWPDNGLDGEMSCDAAGVAVTLYALSNLSFMTQDERHGDLYHLLRDFAAFHAERRAIFAVID